MIRSGCLIGDDLCQRSRAVDLGLRRFDLLDGGRHGVDDCRRVAFVRSLHGDGDDRAPFRDPTHAPLCEPDASVEFPGFSGDVSIRLLVEERCQSQNIRFLGESARPTNSSRCIATRSSVQMMCRVLEVAPSGYYEWVLQPISNRAQEDARLLRLIRASFTASHGIYGAPRVFLDLREAGETCSKHRVARLMRQANLRALHGYRTRRWAVGKPSVLIPNLLQASIHRHEAQHRLGDGHHLHPHVARLALSGRRHGFVLAPDRGLGRSA